MSRLAVSNLIAQPWSEHKALPVSQPSFQFTFQTENHVPFRAPMIGLVSRRILDHAHADITKVMGSPNGNAGISRMLRRRGLAPIGDRKRGIRHSHGFSIRTLRLSASLASGRKSSVARRRISEMTKRRWAARRKAAKKA